MTARKIRQLKARNSSGSMITFSTVLILALVILGLGFVALLMFMGGQSETKNAADSGALNVGRRSLDDISVNLTPGQIQLFGDVASDSETGTSGIVGDNKVTLRRINRVWAKALLMAINADAAGGNAAQGTGNANNAMQAAEEISNALAQKLNNSNNLHGYFSEYASSNSVRMLGQGASMSVQPGAGWQTSLMEREKESNITMAGTPSSNFNLPPGHSFNQSYATQTTRTTVQNAGNKWFLRGYKPLTVGNSTAWQVPFLYEEKPHLVSRTMFEQSQASAIPIGWNQPVPNAFSVHGKAIKNGSLGEQSRSWVLTNPRQTYKASMPHSFFKILIDDPHAEFYFYPNGLIPRTKFGPNQTYGFTPSTKSQTMPLGGLLSSSVTASSVLVGLDVVGRTVDQLIFGVPQGNTNNIEKELTARCNEMISKVGVNVSNSDMHQCLSNPANIGFLVAGTREFLVYSKDGSTLSCKPLPLALADAPWLATIQGNNPDGDSYLAVNTATQNFAGFHLPTVVPLPFHTVALQLGWSNWKKEVSWQPSTGHNGCLGIVKVYRWTEVHSRGVSVPL